ncbi:MAG: phosphoglycerate mutase family protein, partial [Streptococcus mitis]|nr:phosphoglycerate mutase family protein [Streptococcus mitis]
MVKVRLYLVRHGKTMFNTIGRAQGWSDTPLTAEGERGIQELGIGLRESGL